jgi:Asp-tRNA(Asn)/Glu-tRNA(Gln) amidotransferase A subunit family amidase
MGRCVDDLVLIMKTWWNNTPKSPSQSKEDPYIPPIEFRQSAFDEKSNPTRPLRIGYFTDDGWFEASPPCKRAVIEVKEALEKQGHILVPFKPQNSNDVIELYLTIVGADGWLRNIRQGLKGESMVNSYMGAFALTLIPTPIRGLLSSFFRKIGYERLSYLVRCGRELSTIEYQTEISKKNVFSASFTEAFQKEKLDAVLSPGGATPAFTHGACRELSSTLTYHFLYNITHWPAGIVPITTVREDEQHYPTPQNVKHRDMFVAKVDTVMKGSKGLPVGVQIAAPPYSDEECLGVMKVVQSLFPPMPIATNIPFNQ